MPNTTMPEQIAVATQSLEAADTQVANSRTAKTPPALCGSLGIKGASVPNRPGAEYFDNLLWRIESRRARAEDAGYLLGLASCARGAGVSTVAANLAIRAADHGLGPVLLADWNFRYPALHELLRSKHQAGLAEFLSGRAGIDECIHPTPVAGLQLLPLGNQQSVHRLRLNRERIDEVVGTLRERFAFVVCDLPEAGRFGPALLLTAALDATLLVVRSEHARKQSAQQAAHRLLEDGLPLAGAVLTDRRNVVPGWLEWIV